MCWSAEASYALATVGVAATSWAIHKKESPLLWAPLVYFSGMELLQAVTYGVIDQCHLPANQWYTLIGYLHICFQPVFGVMMASYFVPERVRRATLPWMLALAGITAATMVLQLYPIDGAGQCRPGRPLCGPQMCSVSGEWHIAWLVPLNNVGDFLYPILGQTVLAPVINGGFYLYMITMFLVPALIGSWRFVVYHIALGPVLANFTTSNVNESPAVWCLLSIGFLIIVIKTPIRKYMHVKSWPLWRFIPEPAPKAA